MVSQKLIEELQNILKEEYKINLSIKDTKEIGSFLVNYFSLLHSVILTASNGDLTTIREGVKGKSEASLDARQLSILSSREESSAFFP